MDKSVVESAQFYVSISSEKSVLKDEYTKTFEALCAKYEVNSPFELDDDRMREFFAEITSEWKARKLVLYKDGQIAADQL